MAEPAARVLAFTKAPIPGQVKTRFCPPLTPIEAAELSHELCTKTLQNIAALNYVEPELWVAIDPHHEKIGGLASKYQIPIFEQVGENLGSRMTHAFEADHRPTLIIGSDIPQCDTQRLQHAMDILLSGRDVIGPTTDGGYYLIGLQNLRPRLFESIEWGSPSVLRQTLAIAQSMGCPLAQLEPLRDLDTMDDLLLQIDVLPEFEHWIQHLG